MSCFFLAVALLMEKVVQRIGFAIFKLDIKWQSKAVMGI